MGDSENTFPSSKKRAAGRELSRDNPGLDDEEEIPGQETGTFKRASDEVLANRRIVKVKRSQTSSTPSSNPFAAIRLVPTVMPVNNPPEIENTASENVDSPKSVNKETEKDDDDVRKPETTDEKKDESAGNEEVTPVSEKEIVEKKDELVENDENTPVSKKENDEKKDKVAGNDENTPASKKENDEKNDKLLGNDENTPASEKVNDEKNKLLGNDENTPVPDKEKVGNDENTPAVEKDGNDRNTPAPASVNSFQQLSSSQNAFTGIVGTGFSSSTFSFGSIPKPDQTTFPSFSFGTNGNSTLFGNPDKTESTKIPSMQEVLVETGEENEKPVFTADSVLFEFVDGGWKERGKGELKVNVLTSGTQKARLVMRARGNYRLILNASIFPDMKLTNMDKKGITFACLNSTGEEGQNGLSTFALKFKDPSIVDEFRSVVLAHKGNTGVTLSFKTPENSPKASNGVLM